MDAAPSTVLDRIDDAREELGELCLALGNTYAPFGQEAAVAERIHDWYRDNDISSRLVELVEGRANVVARLDGEGGGSSLMFNAHLDTEVSGPDFDHLMQVPDPNQRGGWREGNRLFGHTILNDRHGHALFMIAARAIRDAGVTLRGDLLLTSVAGETGSAPVDEYRGMAYEGKGVGTQYLVDHGVRADFAIVAETTDFAPCWHNTGAIYAKVTLRGRNMYTPRLRRPDDVRDLRSHPNAIVQAAAVVEAIEVWAIEYERARTGPTPCGEVRPPAQVGAIRGGIPYRPNRSAPYCALYVDIRTLPDEEPQAVLRDLAAAVSAVGVDAEVEMVMAKRGAVAEGIEPLTGAIAEAHEAVRGEPPPTEAEPAVVSMWRDSNILNRAGVPALSFGPGRGRAAVQGTGFMELDDLVDAAKMYALTAMRITNR
jgi:acetylornithine deacetylase/succinyl-diaminopimelate desuccinylase-like protein